MKKETEEKISKILTSCVDRALDKTKNNKTYKELLLIFDKVGRETRDKIVKL